MKINSFMRILIVSFVLLTLITIYYSPSIKISAMEKNVGVGSGEVYDVSNNKVDSNMEITKLVKRSIELEKKQLREAKPEKHYVSSQEVITPDTLEEAIDFSHYEKVTVVATGYTAGVESTGKTPDHPMYGITYSGLEVRRDLYSTIAADLTVFPIGTILYIPDYGFGVVADKGGAINGNKIDLYYETVEDVYNEWGKKKVDVYVVKKGNGELTNEQLDQLNENEALQVFRQNILEE